MELPTTPSTPTNHEPRLLVLYGPPKVGKSTLAAKLPNALIVDTENGSSYLSALIIHANNYKDFADLSTALKQPNAPRYDAIIIDTLTRVEEWAEADATAFYRTLPIGKNFEGESVLELPMGAGYGYLRRCFRRYVDAACGMSQRVVFMGHVREKFLNAAGKDVSAIDLDLVGKNRLITCSLADSIGHLTRNEKGDLMVSFKTKETLLCGTRSPELAGQEFKFDWARIYPSLFRK